MVMVSLKIPELVIRHDGVPLRVTAEEGRFANRSSVILSNSSKFMFVTTASRE